MNISELNDNLSPFLDRSFQCNTRIHETNQFFADNAVWIKREDELSSGISGSKYRKYASLIPYIARNFDEMWITGSSQSNNVLGLLQMAVEKRIPYRLYLLQDHDQTLQGNYLWLTLLSNGANIYWLDRSEWFKRTDIFDKAMANNPYLNPLIIPEGASMPEALPGAITLATDLVAQEHAYGLNFQHIFIDSGTGLTAIGLILGLGLLGITAKTIHVTLIAGDESFFEEELVFYQNQLPAYLALTISNLRLPEIETYRPISAPAFGSINQSTLSTIREFAQEEGIITDPLYGAKHADTVSNLLSQKALTGNKLFIHNGGGLGLTGFQDKLAKLA